MPWVEARLRGQKVLARANADGSLASEGGRVEIRYKASDPRAYRAAAGNLKVEGGAVLPDSACVPGEAVAPKGEGEGGASARPARTTSRGGMPTKAAAKASGPRAIPEGAWVAYTDGACSGNPGPAGLGVVLVAPGGKGAREASEYLGVSTNNVAELTAILRAVEGAPADGAPLVVHTDSQYAIGVLQKGWKAKANVELVAKVKAAVTGRKGVELVYVPGHSGVPLNERADELARLAVTTRRTKGLAAD